MDRINNYATMHILTKSKNTKEIKKQIREELKQYEIVHVIIETEDERCDDIECCAITTRVIKNIKCSNFTDIFEYLTLFCNNIKGIKINPIIAIGKANILWK